MSQRKTPRCLHDAHNLGYRSAIAVGTAPAAIPRPGEAMALRPCLTCGQLTTTTRCPTCTVSYDQRRRARRGNRYGGDHQALRRQWAQHIDATGYRCARGGELWPPGAPFHLDHLDDGRLAPSCPAHNSAAHR